MTNGHGKALVFNEKYYCCILEEKKKVIDWKIFAVLLNYTYFKMFVAHALGSLCTIELL